jgi:sarcosine oxidase subunit gamma
MSEPVSALGGKSYSGFAMVREVGPVGMISLRAKPGTKGLDKAIKAASGCALPSVRRIVLNGDRAAGWMSPDEFLVIVPYGEVGDALAALGSALKGQHHLAVDVSDARAVFDIGGEHATDVLMKLSPVDLETLTEGELRRTRAAQVACAFWRQDGGYRVVCFRSVAGYMMGLLEHSSQPGSELRLA